MTHSTNAPKTLAPTVNTLGIDVSKDSLACALLDATQKVVWRKNVPNNASGYLELLKWTPLATVWIVEPTGRHSEGVARAARAAGRDMRLAQPKLAQLFLKSVHTRAKTDKLDALGLAMYGASRSLAPYPLKSEMHDQLDQLLRARKGLSKSVTRLEAQKSELPYANEVLLPAISALRLQISEIDKQIKTLCNAPELSVVKELQKVPGVGLIVAATLASSLTGHTFYRSDQFVAYCGLDIQVRQSGKKTGEGGLSKRGDSELRRLLYLAALANLRSKDSPFAAQYARGRSRGLTTTGALCAVARKLARVAWSMVRHGTCYDPDRVFKINS